MNDERRTRIDSLDAEALTRLLGQLGHEVGTPLGSVLMMADLLGEAQDAASARRHAQGLASAAREIRDLVQTVVRLVRLRTGWLGPTFEEVDGVSSAQRIQAAAARAGIAISTDDDLPVLQIDADYLADAVSLICGWASLRSGDPPDLVELTVRKDGTGLSLELRCGGPAVPWGDPSVLDPLAAGDLVAARRHGGAVLELATARMLVWRLGGSLTGRRDESGGNLVRIKIPAAPRDPLAED